MVLGLVPVFALFVVWKRLRTGHVKPTQELEWSRDIFGQGIEVIRRCPWVLVFPLITEVAWFIERIPYRYVKIQDHAPDLEYLIPVTLRRVPHYLETIHFRLPADFAEAASEIYTAMLSQEGTLVTFVCLSVTVVILLGHGSPQSDSTSGILKTSKRWFWGVLFGLTSGAVLMSFIQNAERTLQNEPQTVWLPALVGVSGIFIVSLANAAILLLMDAAADGRELSLAGALSQVKTCSRALILFGLFMVGLTFAGTLPITLVPTTEFKSRYVAVLWHLGGSAEHVFKAMIAFVPAIVVVRRVQFLPAFKYCVELWARRPRSTAAFVVLSASLLLGPTVLIGHMNTLIYKSGWTGQLFHFLILSVKTAIGVLIMSSMVVFYKKMQEPEGETIQAKMGGD
jgi:hypothetical protein